MFEFFIKKYKKKVIEQIISWTITSIMVILFTLFSIIIVEKIIPSGNIKLIILFTSIYFVITIGRAIATLYEDFKDEKFQKEVVCEYREKLYVKIQNLNQTEIDKTKVGTILETLLNDTNQFSYYFDNGIARVYFGGVIRIIGMLGLLLYINIPIVTISMLIYLLGFYTTYKLNKKSKKFMEFKRKINSEILNYSNEQVQGYSTLRTINIEKNRIIDLIKLLKEYDKSVEKVDKNIRIYTNIYEFIISFILIVTIILGTYNFELRFN